MYWKFGSQGVQPEPQLDSANYSYSKMNQGTNPFCLDDGEKKERHEPVSLKKIKGIEIIYQTVNHFSHSKSIRLKMQ